MSARQIQFTGKLPCITCDYDLRGLVLDGPCPECGTPIAESWHRDLLRFSDLGWLRRVHLGLRFITASFSVPVVLVGIGTFYTGVVTSSSFGAAAERVFLAIMIGILSLAGIAVLAGYPVGLWMALRPQPGSPTWIDPKYVARLRWTGTFVSVIGALGVAGGIMAATANDRPFFRIYLSVSLICVLYTMVHVTFLGPFVRALSMRGHAALRKKTLKVRRQGRIMDGRVFKRLIAGCAILCVGMTVWACLSSQRPYSLALRTVSVVMLLGPVACLGITANIMSELAAITKTELQTAIRLGDRRDAIRELSPTLFSPTSRNNTPA